MGDSISSIHVGLGPYAAKADGQPAQAIRTPRGDSANRGSPGQVAVLREKYGPTSPRATVSTTPRAGGFTGTGKARGTGPLSPPVTPRPGSPRRTPVSTRKEDMRKPTFSSPSFRGKEAPRPGAAVGRANQNTGTPRAARARSPDTSGFGGYHATASDFLDQESGTAASDIKSKKMFEVQHLLKGRSIGELEQLCRQLRN